MQDKGRFDVAFECSAAAPAIRQAIAATRPLGLIVQVGVTGDVPVPVNLLVGKEIALAGTHRFHHEFAEAVEIINAGALAVGRIVTGVYPLEEAETAMEAAADRTRSVKVQISFDG
jgi:L-idonate 5-dehydrogenase